MHDCTKTWRDNAMQSLENIGEKKEIAYRRTAQTAG